MQKTYFFFAYMRWFVHQFEKDILFYFIFFYIYRSHDIQQIHMTFLKTWCGIIRDRKITMILDEKQYRNAATYQDLQAEIRERGFQKPNQILYSKYKTI